MSVELSSSGSKLKETIFYLLVIHSFIFFATLQDFDNPDYFWIGTNACLFVLWIYLLFKKDKRGNYVAFNQKYLLIGNDLEERRIEIGNVISFEKGLLSMNNNKDSWTLLFKNEKNQTESLRFSIMSSSSTPRIFLNRLNKVRRVKEGLEKPQRTVFPKQVIRRKKYNKK